MNTYNRQLVKRPSCFRLTTGRPPVSINCPSKGLTEVGWKPEGRFVFQENDMSTEGSKRYRIAWTDGHTHGCEWLISFDSREDAEKVAEVKNQNPYYPSSLRYYVEEIEDSDDRPVETGTRRD